MSPFHCKEFRLRDIIELSYPILMKKVIWTNVYNRSLHVKKTKLLDWMLDILYHPNDILDLYTFLQGSYQSKQISYIHNLKLCTISHD